MVVSIQIRRHPAPDTPKFFSLKQDKVRAFKRLRLSGATGGGTLTSLAGGRFTATEGYVETVLPLLEGLPAADAVNLTAGLRLSEFSTFGFVSTYQGGLMYRPLRSLTLRAGYGTVFRAPPVTNLYESTLENFTNARDPCGNGPTPQQRENCAANGVPGGSHVQPVLDFSPNVIGGNPDLEPEDGDSVSAGFTFTPVVPDGLSLSVDYWRTEIDDVITLYPDAGLILRVCADEGASGACGRISRFPDGTLERLDATHVNAARCGRGNPNHISFNPLHLCHIHRQTASDKFTQQYTSIGRAGVVLYLSISLWFRVPPFVSHIMNVLWC